MLREIEAFRPQRTGALFLALHGQIAAFPGDKKEEEAFSLFQSLGGDAVTTIQAMKLTLMVEEWAKKKGFGEPDVRFNCGMSPGEVEVRISDKKAIAAEVVLTFIPRTQTWLAEGLDLDLKTKGFMAAELNSLTTDALA